MASRSFSAQRGTLVLSLVIATMLIVAPFVLAGQYVAALVLAAIYTVITAGLNLFMGYTGQISFGHNAFAAIGGYVSAILAMRLGWPPVITIALAAAAAALIALVVGYPTLRLRGHYLAMATLALGLMVFEIATQWKSMTQGLFGLSAIPPFGIGPWELASDASFYYAYWLIAGMAIWVTHRLYHSRLGFAFRAIAGNEEAAQALGVNIASYKLLAFVISAVFASVGGSMFAHYVTYISPEVFGLYMVILLFTMLFVGGINTTFGPLIGAIVITLFPEVLRRFHGARELLYGGVLLLILLFAPKGIYGLIGLTLRLWHSREERNAESASMTALLEVNAISKRFGGLHAVSQVSFSIAQGSISALIGPNGAGKTTLFNLVTGCLPPTDGRIRLEGCDITGVPPFRIAALGVVRTFQLVRVFPDMTVSENLTVGSHLCTRGGVWSAIFRPPWAREADARNRAAKQGAS